MSIYTEFFLNSRSDVVLLDTIEISHTQLSQTYRFVRNSLSDITVTLEDTLTQAIFTYLPMRLTQGEVRGAVEQSLTVELGDVGEILPNELDNIISNNAMQEKPIVTYRAYASNHLTAPLIVNRLFGHHLSFNKEGAVFEAKTSLINHNRTGIQYILAVFPMLKGFL